MGKKSFTQQQRKKRKTEQEEARGSYYRTRSVARTEAAFLLLDEVLHHVLTFVGPGHYRYIAGVTHQFRRVYTMVITPKVDAHADGDSTTGTTTGSALTLGKPPKCETTIESVTESLVRYQLFVDEGGLDLANGKTQRLIFEKAAKQGQLVVLKLATCKRKCVRAYIVWYMAVRAGQWLHENERPLSKSACNYAAERGHLHVLKWLHENGCRDALTCLYAAKGGQLHVLKWLHENECPFDEDICNAAAKGGHLHVLKWLHEIGCRIDAETCTYAALGGQLHVLKWLRKNDCPWDAETYSSAIERHHDDVAEWALTNGCPST